jgi:hypothetical protein
MSRFTRVSRWTFSALVIAVGLGAAGCVAVPVGGYDGGYGYGYGGPSVVFPAPSVVIAPGGGHRHHYGYRYNHRSYGHRGGWRWR